MSARTGNGDRAAVPRAKEVFEKLSLPGRPASRSGAGRRGAARGDINIAEDLDSVKQRRAITVFIATKNGFTAVFQTN